MKNNNHEVHITFGDFVYLYRPAEHFPKGASIEMNREEHDTGLPEYTLECLDCDKSTRLVPRYDGSMLMRFADANQKPTRTEAVAQAEEPICKHWIMIGRALKKRNIRASSLNFNYIGWTFYVKESGFVDDKFETGVIDLIGLKDGDIVVHTTDRLKYHNDPGKLITVSPPSPKKYTIELDEYDLKRIRLWYEGWDDRPYGELDPEDEKASRALGEGFKL